jgi:hypothetical protein
LHAFTRPTNAPPRARPYAQARHSRGMESVVKALVDDAAALSRAQRGAEAVVAGQQAQLQDTKDALLRSAQVRGPKLHRWHAPALPMAALCCSLRAN